jgi:hypothetical protein
MANTPFVLSIHQPEGGLEGHSIKISFYSGFYFLNFSIMGCPSPRVDAHKTKMVYAFVPRAFKQPGLVDV